METDVQEKVENPFANAPVVTAPTAVMTQAATQREMAEVQAMMMIARANPRDQMRAMDRILVACTRPKLAESALYTYGRGGTDITGPSIRLAEAIAQNWQNIDFGIRELEQRNGESTVEAYAWDTETNVRQRKVFQVRHERHTKRGAQKLTDPRDIYETVANNGARRLRACILGVIPGDVIEQAVQQCEVTLRTKAEVTEDRLKALIEKFAEFDVTREMIEKRIQRRLDAMTPAQLVQMGKIYNSLKDGMSGPADWFEAPAKPENGHTEDAPAASRTDEVKRRMKQAKPDAKPAVTLEVVQEHINKVLNTADLDTATMKLDETRMLIEEMESPDDQVAATNLMQQAGKELEKRRKA